MTIEQAKAADLGVAVAMNVLLVKKDVALKTNKDEYLSLSVSDASGSLTFPIWTSVEHYKEALQEGQIYKLVGTTGQYQNNFQLKMASIEQIAGNIADYLPHYEIPQSLKDYFNTTLNNMDESWRDFVMACLKKVGVDKFLLCPAAVNHHHNRLGGLFLHTVGLMKNVDNMIATYCENPFWDFKTTINPSRLMAKAILHDIMKVKEYAYETGISRKKIAADHRFMGTGLFTSVNEETKLLSEEDLDSLIYSVLSHHGKYGEEVVPPKYVEDVLLHAADMIDSQIIKAAETGNEKIY